MYVRIFQLPTYFSPPYILTCCTLWQQEVHVYNKYDICIIECINIFLNRISWPDGPFDYNISKYTPVLESTPGTATNIKKPQRTASSVGPEVVHIYEVTNLGPSPLEEVWVYLLWPSKTLDGQPLLYLLEQPMVVPQAVCWEAEDVNSLGLVVSCGRHI